MNLENLKASHPIEDKADIGQQHYTELNLLRKETKKERNNKIYCCTSLILSVSCSQRPPSTLLHFKIKQFSVIL